MFKWQIDSSCELRLLEKRHVQAWFDLVMQDKEHMRPWLPWVDDFKTLEDAHTFLQMVQNNLANNTGMRGGIWFNGILVGGVSYQEIIWANSTISIGCWVSKPYQGQGIATRCLTALIDYAVNELKINRVESRTLVENTRARALSERLCMKPEGVLRKSLKMGDAFVDEVVYSILAFEWQSQKR